MWRQMRWLSYGIVSFPCSFTPFFPSSSLVGLFIDDMGIGGQAKQLLHQGMKNKPNTKKSPVFTRLGL